MSLSQGPCFYGDTMLQLSGSASEWINLVFKYSCRWHTKSVSWKKRRFYPSPVWDGNWADGISCQKLQKIPFSRLWQMGFFVPLIYIRQQFIFFLCRRPMGSIIVLVRSACSRESRKFVILSVLLFSKSSTTTQLLVSILRTHLKSKFYWECCWENHSGLAQDWYEICPVLLYWVLSSEHWLKSKPFQRGVGGAAAVNWSFITRVDNETWYI